MFNISFGEIFIIATIGLIIIGPQRLPETARFIGHLLSRLQRQAASIKADVRREMDLEDMKNIQREYRETAKELQQSLASPVRELNSIAADAAKTVSSPSGDTPPSSTDTAVKPADNTTNP